MFKLARRRRIERSSLSAKEVSALAFANEVLKLATDLVAAAIADVDFAGVRDPKIIGLALLCRSISNCKGALAMARDNQAIEARALVRLCTENLFLVAELCESGSDFVVKMREDNAAHRISLGELGLKEPGVADAEEGKIIRDLIKAHKAEFPKPRKLPISETAKGLMERVYPSYKMLSHDSVHPSIDALRRHNRPIQEHNRWIMTMNLVAPFRPGERLDTLNKAAFALLAVCVGVNDLFGGTSQNDAVRALFEQFKSASA
jgi:Family of unknown function (DUF5677)